VRPVVEKGVLDLRGWDFEKDGNIALNGEWKFYWNIFLNPDSLETHSSGKETYINVPDLWKNIELKGKSYSPHGYATYSLNILIDSTNQKLKLFTKYAIYTSSVVYANGEKIGSNGVLGLGKDPSTPSDHQEFFSFLPSAKTVKIIMLVSNETNAYSGGILSELKIGAVNNINIEKNEFLVTWIFISGAIFILMILQFFFYFSLSQNKSYLYLGITGMLILLYFSVNITRELGIFSFHVNHTLSIIGWTFSLPLLMFYLKSIFKGIVNKYVPIVLLFIAFITLITYLAGYNIDFYRMVAIVAVIYLVIIALIALFKKMEHARRFLVGLSILAVTIVNDLLIDLDIINTMEVVHFGIFTFLLIQVYAESSNFTKAYQKNLKLSEELFSINRNLESHVIDRTRKIEDQNIQLKSLIATKDRFFSIIAHDLRSPISSMLSILDLFSTNRDHFDEKSTELMIRDIHKSTDKTYNLLENLLNWARSQRGEINYKPENIELSSIINSNIDLVTIPIEKKQINLTGKTKQNLLCFADKSMLDLVIRNLLSNAIKFTPIGGDISINWEEQDLMISVTIKDSGIGINEENLAKLFDSGVKFSTWGTEGEKGSGLGLVLSKEFVEKNKGTLKVKSEEGKGSSLIFTIPKGTSN